MLYQKPSVLLFPDYVFVLHASMYPDAEALENNSSIHCDFMGHRTKRI